jgi:putative peptide zinc metalloprotease protein
MALFFKEVMTSSLPRLRSDLIVRPQQTTQGTSVVIKNPESRKFFRLGEAEYFIAQQLDGETPLEAIRQKTEAKFGGELAIEILNAFLENLKKNHILETTEAGGKGAYREPPRFRGSPLYCRFKVFDPCRLLQRLVPWTGFFYSSFFVLLSAAAILAAAGVTVTSWGDFRQDLPRLYGSWSSIAVVLALNFLVVGCHEFGHGLTCTRFGGEVHEMGCALVFLQPAFYCNVSDAWLFAEKSKRLWVGIAGPYFELFLWSLAVLIWRTTEPDTWINFITLSVMATSGVKTLLNFNPLIKLDGYYLLSDYLEIPNLRRRSFRHVGSLVEKLFGLESLEDEEVLPRSERAIFSIYGTLALAGSFSILGFILLSAGGALVDGRSPTAVLVTLGLLGMKYRRRLRRMFGKPSGASDSFDDEDFDTPEKADGVDESSVPKETEATGNARSAHEPATAREVGKVEVKTPVMVSHVVESAVPANGNPLETRTGNGELERLSNSEERPLIDPSQAGVTSDQLLAMMYGRRIQKILGSSSEVSSPFGNDEGIEPRRAVAVLDESATPNDVDRFQESAPASSVPETAGLKNGHGTSMPGGAGRVYEATPPKNGDETERPATPATSERAAALNNGDHSEAPDVISRLEKHDHANKKKSRRWGRRVRRTVWVALAAGAAVGLVRGHAELRVAGPFNVLPIENSDVRASVDGVVDKIYVHEGDYVREGQPIARLTDIDTRAALEKTEAQLAEAGAKLRMQVAGPTANEIEVAKANVTKTEDNLKYAQIKLAMAKRVFDENLLSRKEYEDVAAVESAARNDLAVAKDQLQLLASGTRPEDIEATKAQIDQLQADQRHLGEQRRMLTVYSPSTGVVATPTLQLKQLTHQLVKKGDLIAKVFDLQTVTAQIAVDEKDIADVQVDQKVVLRARAYPDEVFYGTVNFVSTSVLGSPANGGEATPLPVAPSSSSSSTKRTILISTQIDNHSLLLKPEMTGQAKILCGQRRALDLVTRRLVHTVKVEFWSWW